MNFTKKEVLDCCQLSINCYQGKHGKIVELLTDKIEFKFKDGMKYSYAYVGWIDNDFYISFEGTNGTFKEWRQNLNFKKSKIPFCTDFKVKVHKGFLDHYKVLRRFVVNQINLNFEKIVKNKSTVYMTGHSLGATAAILCYLDLAFKNIPLKLITFGSPRIFNRYGRKYFNRLVGENSLRVVKRNDIVCKVPTLWLGFYHIANKLWVDKMTKKEVLLHPWLRIFGNPQDHEPEDYYAKCKKYFK